MDNNNPIRVLHLFSPSFGARFSGHEKRWKWQFSQWEQPAIQHKLINPKDILITPASSESTITTDNVLINRWNRGIFALKIITVLWLHRKVFEVLHIHSQNWAGLLAGAFCKLINKNSVYEISLLGSDNPTALRKEAFGSLKFFLFKQVNKVICTSMACKIDCLHNGLNKQSIELVMNPVDHNLFQPIPEDKRRRYRVNHQIHPTEKVILFVGSIKKRKGLDTLLEIFLEINNTRDDCIFILAGPSSAQQSPGVDDHFVEDFKDRANALIEGGKLILTGRIDSPIELAEYYQMADLFLFASEAEGLPNVILESLSSSLPTLAVLLPGVTDLLIDNHKTGFLFNPADIQQALKYINLILEDPKTAKNVSISARKFIEKNHTFGIWQSNMTKIYQRIIANRD